MEVYYAGLFSGISTTGTIKKNLILGQAVYNKRE